MRLDEEKLEALRSWGERLGESGDVEHAAIGRAILMLVEEIDRLHIDLWHARMQPSEGELLGTAAKTEEVAGEEPVASSLHGRLQRALRRNQDVEPAEQPASHAEGDKTTSPQAWIAAMRRQR